LKLTPCGSVPDAYRVGVGSPVAVTVKLPPVPSVNVVLAAEVIAGASSTVSLVVPDEPA
jgi:hypothetical protein